MTMHYHKPVTQYCLDGNTRHPKAACGAIVTRYEGNTRSYILDKVTCLPCRETQDFQDALCTLEIAFDGNIEDYRDHLAESLSDV